MRAGGTRRDDRVVRPHQAVFDRDLTRDQVDQPTVNEMGADSARPLFVEHDRFAFDPRQAADPRADRTARAEAFLLGRSEEHTSELQSLMRNSYAVFCLKQKNRKTKQLPTLIGIRLITYQQSKEIMKL